MTERFTTLDAHISNTIAAAVSGILGGVSFGTGCLLSNKAREQFTPK